MGLTFSLAHLTALSCPPPELTYIAATAGYDFVSPRIIMTGSPNELGHNYDLAQDHAMYRNTRKALLVTGLKIHDIELVRITDTLKPRTLAPIFEIAAELGAQHVLTSIWTRNRALATELFAELCDVGLSCGLKISLEFVTWSNVITLRDALEVLYAAGRSNARLTIDLLHAHRSRVTPDELAVVPAELFSFVHLCDAPPQIPDTEEGLIHTGRAERLYLGEGGLDIIRYLNAIPNVTYSIEIPHLARTKELGSQEHASRCLQTAKAYFAAKAFNGSLRLTPSIQSPRAM